MMGLLEGLLYAATVVWWIFCFWYTVRSKWWKKINGRNTFGVSLGLALMLGGLSSLRVFGWQDWNVYIWCLVLLLLLVFGLDRLIRMEHIQRGKKQPPEQQYRRRYDD